MEAHIQYINTALNAAMRVAPKGQAYWYARDLVEILDYSRWENLLPVIEKAEIACNNSGSLSNNHFLRMQEMVEIGSGAKTKRENMILSRYACYLIAMNGDPNKPQVATAQTYFAAQTHAQEMEKALSDQQRRVLLRSRIKDANKSLAGAAQNAGVKKFAVFQDAGYKGLYGGRNRDEIKALKGIAPQDDLLDCIDREELAANEFRITQTEAKLKRDKIQGEQGAIDTHHGVGKKVREAIAAIQGTMPEKLPAAPSIKKLTNKQDKETKKLNG